MNIHGIITLRNVKGIFLFLVLLFGIGFGAYFLNQQGGFELRKKAADTKGSQLVFTAPKQVEVGKPFTVELVLDTTGDPDYTISGVDAVVSWSSDFSGYLSPAGTKDTVQPDKKFLPNEIVQLLSVTPGTIFESYPMQQKSDLQPSVEGTKLGAPQSGGGGSIPSSTTTTGGSGQSQVTVCPPFPGCDAINNWQLGMAFPACWGDALTKCPAPTSKPRSDSNPLTISGVKNYAVDEKGYFKGFSGKGVFATFTFIANMPGTITLSLRYDSNTATNDTNINGFIANQPVSLQKPSERLLVGPGNLFIAVRPTQTTPTPTPVNECIGKPDGSTCGLGVDCPICPPGSTTCQLRPCAQQVGVCRNQKCEPVIPATPTPAPTCVPEPPCAYEGVVDKNGVRVYCSTQLLLLGQTYCPRPTRTPTPSPTCMPLPRCAYEGSPVCDLAAPPPGTSYCARPTPTPTPWLTPTPTPVPSARLNIYVESDGKAVHRQVRVYGQRDYVTLLNQVQGVQVYAAGFGDLTSTSSTPVPSSVQNQPIPTGKPPVSQPPEPASSDGLTLLGSAVTDSAGNVTIEIPSQYHNIPWRLFIQTPSHLIRQAQMVKLAEIVGTPGSVVGSTVIVFRPNTIAGARFTNLIPGDVFIAEGKTRQDGVVNNFDIAELFRAWGPYAKAQVVPAPPSLAADLNDDGVVNNRDFAILLSNFNKRGDTQFPPFDIRITPTRRPLPVTTIAPQ